MNQKQKISVVWFKRDLRLHDNEAIWNALESGAPVLFLYVFENLLRDDPHYSERHWNFIKQSLEDINNALKPFNTKVLAVKGEMISTLNQLQNHYQVTKIFSHQETGLLITYNRDKEFQRYCRNNRITWKENINNGVFRGLSNRESWFEKWEEYMNQVQFKFEATAQDFISLQEIDFLSSYLQITSLYTEGNTKHQHGGTSMAWKYANSFFSKRHFNYMLHISQPENSRSSCSRLSPYIAWGNVSIREIFQRAKQVKREVKNKHHLSAFLSRLRWQAHFIQKFEMEYTMEMASVNKGYHKLKKTLSKKYQEAWQTGQTGYPLIDAAMRCLNETGYINFRMRAMLVSFFTHLLWQPWQGATHHLSRNFLDFEPGIHFPQLQMQAGETGINNLRIYNPIKNGIEHDPGGVFIKKWVPELAHLPIQFVHEPSLMTPLDQQFNNCILGKDYPKPIVALKEHHKHARDILWGMKNDSEVKSENKRILMKHTLKNRKRLLKDE